MLKWVGGKHDHPGLISSIGVVTGVYREPFAGGLGSLLRVLGAGCATVAVCSDANRDLIALHNEARHRPHELHAAVLDLLPRSGADYYALRARWNSGGVVNVPEPLVGLERAAAMIALNRSCFNGLFRVNRHGELNAAWGKNPAPFAPSLEEFVATSAALACVTFRAEAWQDALARANAGDTVYLDPPYLELREGSDFAGYTPGGFGLAEHEALAAACWAASTRGVRVLLSNHDTPEIRELYARFCGVVVWAGDVQSRVSRSANRPPRQELIVRWGTAPAPVGGA